MSEGLVWLSGSFLDFSSAKVSVEDRGFQFGDGVYEVVRVYEGRPFAFSEHLERLRRSSKAIDLELPMSDQELQSVGRELIARAAIDEAELYIQATRGAARRLHLYPTEAQPTVIMTVRPVRTIAPELREKGIAVITHPDERWARCDIKSICLLPNVMAKQRAFGSGAYEAILVRDGLVMEGSSSNVFLFAHGELATPMADHRILRGITREFVLHIARQKGYRVVERDISLAEMRSAEEVMLTSTTVEVMSVVVIDGQPVGAGFPGNVFRDLYEAYREKISTALHSI